MDKLFDRWILASRWVLLPLYMALLIAMTGIFAMVGRELLHLVLVLVSASESEIVLIILTLLDLVLLANLVVMVAVSSYESFISRIEVGDGVEPPEWLGKLDSSNVKVKVALSIVMISAISLLRVFMTDAGTDRIVILAGVHVVFVASALAIAIIDRIGRLSH